MSEQEYITNDSTTTNVKNASGCEIAVIRSLEQIGGIRQLWEQMQQNESSPKPNADINRYLSVISSADHEVKPHIMISYHNNQPQAMLIGRIGKIQITYKLGYKVLFKPSLRGISVVYGGVIGNLNSDVCASLVRGLVDSIRQGEADVVFFNSLKTDSPMWHAIKEDTNSLCRPYFLKEEFHYRMTVPDSLEQFYRSCSKKHRANLKRYIRKLEQEFEGRVKVITYSRDEDLEALVKAAVQISSQTYQYGLGCGFVDDKHTQILMTTAAKMKWLQAHVMYIDDRPCSFQFGLKYGRVYFLEQIGFDFSWEKFEVGTVLFLRVLENLCKDRAVKWLDFGFGNARYKEQYADEHWMEVSTHLFARRPIPICINISHSFMTGLNSALEHALIKTRFLPWIKKRWRSLLQQREHQANNRSRG